MRLVAAALLAVLGLALMAQVQTRDDDEALAGYREQDLLTLVTGLGGSIARSQQNLADLRASQQQLREDLTEARLALSAAEDRARRIGVLAGSAPASGPGIVAQVEDPQGEVSSELLLDLVQDLRSAGAEAIEVDGVRLGARSWFAGEAGDVEVDGIPLERPYVVRAVGRPSPLEGALTFPQGGADRIRDLEAAVVTSRTPEVVEIDSVREVPPIERAEPVGPTP